MELPKRWNYQTMELPKRKKLRLNGYEYSSCGAHFVTICVKDRDELLGEFIAGDDVDIVPCKSGYSPNCGEFRLQLI